VSPFCAAHRPIAPKPNNFSTPGILEREPRTSASARNRPPWSLPSASHNKSSKYFSPIFPKAKRGHCGVASEQPQTPGSHVAAVSPFCAAHRPIAPKPNNFSTPGILETEPRTSASARNRPPWSLPSASHNKSSKYFPPIFPKAKRGHCGVVSEQPQTPGSHVAAVSPFCAAHRPIAPKPNNFSTPGILETEPRTSASTCYRLNYFRPSSRCSTPSASRRACWCLW
jgi:hypothetical protein